MIKIITTYLAAWAVQKHGCSQTDLKSHAAMHNILCLIVNKIIFTSFLDGVPWSKNEDKWHQAIAIEIVPDVPSEPSQCKITI